MTTVAHRPLLVSGFWGGFAGFQQALEKEGSLAVEVDVETAWKSRHQNKSSYYLTTVKRSQMH